MDVAAPSITRFDILDIRTDCIDILLSLIASSTRFVEGPFCIGTCALTGADYGWAGGGPLVAMGGPLPRGGGGAFIPLT